MAKVTELDQKTWGTLDISSDIVTECNEDVTQEICSLLVAGLPLPLACDLIGLNITLYKDWVHRGAMGETPFNKFTVCVKKAMALWVHTLTVEACDPTNENWRRALEMLKSTKSEYYGGVSAKAEDFTPVDQQYL